MDDRKCPSCLPLCVIYRHNDWESAKELIQEMESEVITTGCTCASLG